MAADSLRLSLRRVLIYTHRWLGIAGSLLFVGWFASGIVMMYARMPRLTPDERLFRLEPLDLSGARVAPVAVWPSTQPPERIRVGMLAGRPVYHFLERGGWRTVFADDGQPLDGLTPEAAEEIARRFVRAHAGSATYDGHLLDADQWTLQVRALLPAHRIALNDVQGTRLYISERTGEPILQTTRTGRRWGYAGAVVHWLYLTPLRRHSGTWAQVVIWLSVAGCVACLTGLVWGVWRYSAWGRYRLKDARSRSPYSGAMRYHHYVGFVFGLCTFTWVFSGLLSMNPGDWSPSTSPTAAQRRAVAGGPLRLEALTLDRLRAAMASVERRFAPRELEIVQFRGAVFVEAYRPPASPSAPIGEPGEVLAAALPFDHLLVSLAGGEEVERFEQDAVADAARAAMPGVGVERTEWLERYDSYYYDRDRRLPLPVLKVRYLDAERTWLYVDPRRGAIVRKEERRTRLNRWLYRGLHSWDWPGLYDRRPLWDIVVIALSLGGITSAVTPAAAVWRRLRRHTRRWTARWRNRDVS